MLKEIYVRYRRTIWDFGIILLMVMAIIMLYLNLEAVTPAAMDPCGYCIKELDYTCIKLAPSPAISPNEAYQQAVNQMLPKIS